MGVTCDECGAVYTTITNRNRHMRAAHDRGGPYECIHCKVTFTAQDRLRAHIQANHSVYEPTYKCSICKEDFASVPLLQQHGRDNHMNLTGFQQVANAFQATCVVMEKLFPYEGVNASLTVEDLFAKMMQEAQQEMRNQLIQREQYKVWMSVCIDMIKPDANGDIISYDPAYFYSKPDETCLIYRDADIPRFLQQAKTTITSVVDKYLNCGSNWRIHSIRKCTLKFGKCQALNGACVSEKISIAKPCEIHSVKKEEEDNRQYPDGCLLYAVASFLKKTEDMRILDDFIATQMNLQGVKLPVTLKALKSFEEKNEHLDFKLNVLECFSTKIPGRRKREYKVFPLRCTPLVKATHIINLLWVRYCNEPYEDDDEEDDEDEDEDEDMDYEEEEEEGEEVNILKDCTERGHYFLIEDLSVFLATPQYKKRHFCSNCLHSFYTKQLLIDHQSFCNQHKPQIVHLPEKGSNILKFGSFNKKFKAPFIGFYDFEAVLKPRTDLKCQNCHESNSLCTHRSSVENEQKPSSFSLIILNDNREIIEQEVYTGEDAIEVFLDKLFHIGEMLDERMHHNETLIMSQLDTVNFTQATSCHICDKNFSAEDSKVRDHNHMTGKYLGAAHSACNILRRQYQTVPMFCHNSKNYDSHFIFQALKLRNGDGTHPITKLNAIAENTEKFKIFNINNFCFVDSAAFLNVSLQNLADDLNRTPLYEYSILNQTELYQPHEVEKKALLMRKGVYPYEYISSFDVYRETQLPPKSSFNSKLTNSEISDEDYMHACKVFETFKCRNIQSYTELYCLLDCALLAEIVCQFRDEIYNDAQLDICKYISLPQLTLDFMLKKTKNEIELITDIDQLLMVENNIRGGLSFINQRSAINDENSIELEKELLYIDANNLYGWAMSQPLPVSNFNTPEVETLSHIDWENIDINGDTGYILEVDLLYPEHLHELHSSFPLAPENWNITYDELSPYAKMCLKVLRNEEKYSAMKLITSLRDKKNYVIHFASLRLYLRLGLKLQKIHKVLSFKQAPILEPYIRYCTEKRKNSTSSFQGSIFKILSNSLFGKMLESVRGRLKCSFVRDEARCKRLLSDNNCFSFKVINEELVAVFKKEREVTIDKPYAMGFTVLERSKDFMAEFYYSELVPRFEKVVTLMTDTDSLAVEIRKKPADIHLSSMEILHNKIDFSNYPKNHPLFNPLYKNQLGFFKDELEGQKMIKFVGLRSKTYALRVMSIRNNEYDEQKKAKGITKGYKDAIPFEMYERCLYSMTQETVQQFQIRSHNHTLVTNRLSKVCFSSFDDKRYIKDCGIHSIPYGSTQSTNCDICVCQRL